MEAARRIVSGEGEMALAALSEAAAIDPDCLALHFVVALMAWRSGDFAGALKVMRACFEREPMNGTIADALASLFAQAGDLRESLFHGKLAAALRPDPAMQTLVPADFPAFGKAFLAIQDRPLFAHAKYCRAQGEIAQALDRAGQHVEIVPGDVEARQFYVELLLRSGMAGMAVEVLRPVVGRDGGTPALASLFARALTEVGDFDEARRWHDRAHLADPRSAAIAAARLADSVWLGDDAKEAATAAAKWAKDFTKPGKPAQRRASAKKLVIGYLVSDFFDRTDIAAVAAVARAHDRSGVQVVGYGIGAKGWHENAVLGGAFDQWRDISRLDPATFARTLAGDDLDLVIDVAGLAAPGNLAALARASSMLRVAWLHNPAGLEAIYDATIANDDRGAVPSLRCWAVGWGAYPMVRDRRDGFERTPAQGLRLGADVGLRQLNRETVALWSTLLTAIPQSTLLLRQNDMKSPENINRLVQRFGRDLAARVDIVDAESSGAFYRQVDLAVPPTVGTSPRMVAESLAFGVPAVVLRRSGGGQPYAAVLEALGLGADLVAGSSEDYVAKAKSLAISTETRSRVDAAIAAAIAGAEASASDIARSIEQAARKNLAERGA
jgi:Flp pilus assembly protein TadD